MKSPTSALLISAAILVVACGPTAAPAVGPGTGPATPTTPTTPTPGPATAGAGLVGGIVFAYDRSDDALAVLDLATGQVSELGPVGNVYSRHTFLDHTRALVEVDGDDDVKMTVARAASGWALGAMDPTVESVSPDGAHAYVRCAQSNYCVAPLADGKLGALAKVASTHRGMANAWRGDGRIVTSYGDAGATWVELIDGSSGAATAMGSISSHNGLDASADGSLFAWGDAGNTEVGVAAVDDLAKVRFYDLGDTNSVKCAFADGDRRLVCVHHGADGGASGDLVDSIELATGTVTTLDTHGFGGDVRASPDGAYVVYTTQDGDATGMAISPVDHADVTNLLDHPTDSQFVMAWLR